MAFVGWDAGGFRVTLYEAPEVTSANIEKRLVKGGIPHEIIGSPWLHPYAVTLWATGCAERDACAAIANCSKERRATRTRLPILRAGISFEAMRLSSVLTEMDKLLAASRLLSRIVSLTFASMLLPACLNVSRRSSTEKME